jgi:hypothetical protein
LLKENNTGYGMEGEVNEGQKEFVHPREIKLYR